MSLPRVVLDTNVIVSALRSRRGPSFRLLSLTGSGRHEICLSVPLVLEYEEVLKRRTALGEEDILAVIRQLTRVAHRQPIFFLWRPILPDSKDDMVLELAVASRAPWIVTYNLRDFREAASFGVMPVTPETFLTQVLKL